MPPGRLRPAIFQLALTHLQSAIAESGAHISTGELPVVDGNYDALLRVFQNLIGNAIQYRSADPPKVRVSARMRGGDWIFAVEDNGIGIDMRYADRIFEAFRRLHSRDEIEGSGIGLALSQPGKGLTFFSTLPRRTELAVSIVRRLITLDIYGANGIIYIR